MKMYYFDPNDYGNTLLVMAASKEDAIKSVEKYLDEEDPGEDLPTFYEEFDEDIENWIKFIPNFRKPYKKYTIEELEENQVLKISIQ